MRKYIFLVGVGLLFLSGILKGQVSTYVFTPLSGTYTSISGGTEVTIIEDDEEVSTAIPIGFTFSYSGSNYTQILVSSNGWLSFNTGLTDPMLTNSLSNSDLIRPALYPLWDDHDGFDGVAYYQVSGTSPNRVFTFEWGSYYWNWLASTPGISFQIKLFETTNAIEFVYRQESGSLNSPSATIGLAGITAGDYLTLNNSSASPTASSSIFSTSIASKPATGQIYRFAPPVCSGTPAGGSTAATGNPVCYNTSFTLSVTGSTSGVSGLTYQWQSSPDGSTWTNISGATATTYSTSIATSTWFRRAITCSGNTSYSTGLQVVVQTPATTITPASVCVNSSSVLTATASAASGSIFSENFEGTLQMAIINGTPHDAGTEWILQSSPYTYTGTSSFTFQSPGNNKFMLANSDAIGTISNTNTRLTSPVINVSGYTTLSLSFNHHYNAYDGPEQGTVEVSTNGGGSWTTVATYNTDIGTPTAFVPVALNLSTYAGSASLMFRFNYTAAWDWFWAVDDIILSGTASSVSYAWTASPATGAGLPAGAGTLSTSNNSVTVTPTITGTINYTVTTSNSCLAPATVILTSTTGSLIASSACRTQTVATGDNYFVDAGCNLFAKIVPQGGSPVAGSVSTCVTFNGTVQFHNGQPYLQRHYDIEPTVNASTSTARITLYATQAEFDAVNAADLLLGDNWPDLPTGPADVTGIAAVKVTQWHGTPLSLPSSPGNYTDPNAIYVIPASVTWNAASTRWEIEIDVVGFSGFYIHTGYGFPLPTLLISFNGRREGGVNRLSWTSTTEQNTRGYSVERSSDGQHFAEIGFVNSLAQGGNSNSTLNYGFTDNTFTGDKQYYRLKQVDLSGRVKISSIVLIKSTESDLLTMTGLYPNPAESFINLTFESPVRDNLNIIISDINGRAAGAKKVIAEKGSNNISLDINQLMPGTYFIKISCASGCEMLIRKFIKQ
jgi:hypothetical protein